MSGGTALKNPADVFYDKHSFHEHFIYVGVFLGNSLKNLKIKRAVSMTKTGLMSKIACK